MERKSRVVGAGGEIDLGGPEEVDDRYGGGFPGDGRSENRRIGCSKDWVPGDRITGWM